MSMAASTPNFSPFQRLDRTGQSAEAVEAPPATLHTKFQPIPTAGSHRAIRGGSGGTASHLRPYGTDTDEIHRRGSQGPWSAGCELCSRR